MTCPIGTDIPHAASLLRNGGLVAFATETVFGLGANAFDLNAVARLFEVKNRPRFDARIVHVNEPTWLERLATNVPEEARQLAGRFWPGPLSLVLPKSDAVPDLVTAGLSTVAVRPLAALFVLRENVIHPLISGHAQLQRGPPTETSNPIDIQYNRLQREMQKLFKLLHIAA